jgi:hypothetical protein
MRSHPCASATTNDRHCWADRELAFRLPLSAESASHAIPGASRTPASRCHAPSRTALASRSPRASLVPETSLAGGPRASSAWWRTMKQAGTLHGPLSRELPERAVAASSSAQGAPVLGRPDDLANYLPVPGEGGCGGDVLPILSRQPKRRPRAFYDQKGGSGHRCRSRRRRIRCLSGAFSV